ncbi:MAG: hypothetical protein JWM12_3372, partial [Ilumatobacteraceae bacterium]|nr:hypothetical protein [Ilumatobacteraceae bacterium]
MMGTRSPAAATAVRATVPGARPVSSTTETVSVTVERGWQVLVASGFHLRAVSDEHSEANTSAFARRLETWIGPGLVVLAGDTFELLDEPNNSPRRALTAHPRFAAALRGFAEGAEHTVVVLAGDHDAGVLVEPHRAEVIAMGATVAARLELEIESGAGLSRIRVEHRAAPGRAPMVDEDEVAESAEFYRVLDRWWWLPLVAPIVVALVVFGVVALRGAASWEISR